MVQDIKEIWDPDCNLIWAIAYTYIFIAKNYRNNYPCLRLRNKYIHKNGLK